MTSLIYNPGIGVFRRYEPLSWFGWGLLVSLSLETDEKMLCRANIHDLDSSLLLRMYGRN